MMLPWQKIVSWLAAASFMMLITWGTWVTISLTTDMAASADAHRRLTRVEEVMGTIVELRSDLRVLSVELRSAQDQLKHRVCYEQ